MKLSNNTKKQAGLTLIEITLVIAVLLGLISVLFIGVTAYKEGSNRAKCILNISNVQKAARSYQNLYEKEVDNTFETDMIIGAGRLIDTAPVCPSSGTYAFAATFPALGTPFMSCSLAAVADGEHVPKDTLGW